MTFKHYNALSSEDKVRFQWQVWRKHLATLDMGASGFLWNRLYGHKRFMVNSRGLPEKDRWIFEREELSIKSMESEMKSPSNTPDISPVMYFRQKLDGAKEVVVREYINNRRYYWLQEPLVKGERFKIAQNHNKNCSLWGVPVMIENEGGKKRIYELPWRELTLV